MKGFSVWLPGQRRFSALAVAQLSLEISPSRLASAAFIIQQFCIARITPQKRSFLRKIGKPDKERPKWVKPLSILTLDFSLAKGKSAVELRES